MENVDSGWEKKEWSCVDDFWGKGCGWKGSGSDCVNIGWYGDLPVKGCPNCGHRLFSVDSPLVRSKTETSTKSSSGTRTSNPLPPPPPARPLTPEGRRRKAEMDRLFHEMLANWGKRVEDEEKRYGR